jgi:hypothetical protein
VWRILDGNDIKPHKIHCYLEKRDPKHRPQDARSFDGLSRCFPLSRGRCA